MYWLNEKSLREFEVVILMILDRICMKKNAAVLNLKLNRSGMNFIFYEDSKNDILSGLSPSRDPSYRTFTHSTHGRYWFYQKNRRSLLVDRSLLKRKAKKSMIDSGKSRAREKFRRIYQFGSSEKITNHFHSNFVITNLLISSRTALAD